MYMFCDSAYFYEASNSLDAFGNVRMEQGDTLFVYSDVMFYDGVTQIARLREKRGYHSHDGPEQQRVGNKSEPQDI